MWIFLGINRTGKFCLHALPYELRSCIWPRILFDISRTRMSNVQCVFACACSIQLCSWKIFHTEWTTVRMSSLYLSMVLHSSMTLYPEPEKYIRNSKLFLAVTIGCFKRRATFEPKQHKPTPTFREHRFLLSIDRKTISRLVRTIIQPQLNGCNLGKLLRRKTLKTTLDQVPLRIKEATIVFKR